VLARVESPERQSLVEQERATLSSLSAELARWQIESKQQALLADQEIDLARVALDAARRGMERAERSKADGILNEAEYEESVDELRRTELELKHAEQDARLIAERHAFERDQRRLEVDRQELVVAEVERQVGELTIRSPVDGQVSRLDVADLAPVTTGQALVGVVDLSTFEVEMRIPEAYADDIAADTSVEIRYEGDVFPGQVRMLSPEVENNEVLARAAFVDAPAGLRQNQRLSVRILLETRADVLKVERGPFLEAGGGRTVYVVDDSLAILRRVETGVVSVGEVEIVDGLEAGEQIVISDTARFEGAERIYLSN
jgi:HlyD family secretion protein